MNPLTTSQIQPVGDRPDSEREKPRKPATDHKISRLIVSSISLPALKEGSLLASATAPHVVIPATRLQKDHLQMPRGKPTLIRRKASFPSRYFPVGLLSCDSYHWINALMQLILFIPSIRDIFSHTPKSLFPFNEFIDAYFSDMGEKRAVSQADAFSIIRCLQGKFPYLFRDDGVANLYEVIQAISQSACASAQLPDALFRKEWQILWDQNQDLSLSEIWQRKIAPPEIFIGLQLLYDPLARQKPEKLFCRSLQKQYFSMETSIGYELDAFVECRMEEEKEGNYFAYLKIDGAWVQCADERILPIRHSTTLDLPIRRGILFHYRRVSFGNLW